MVLLRLGEYVYKNAIEINNKVEKTKRSAAIRRQIKNRENYISYEECKGVIENTYGAALNLHEQSVAYLKIRYRGFTLLFPISINFRLMDVLVTPPLPSRKREPLICTYCVAKKFSHSKSAADRFYLDVSSKPFSTVLNIKEEFNLTYIIAQVAQELYLHSIWGGKATEEDVSIMEKALDLWFKEERNNKPINTLLNYSWIVAGDMNLLAAVKRYLWRFADIDAARTSFEDENVGTLLFKLKKFKLPTTNGFKSLPVGFHWVGFHWTQPDQIISIKQNKHHTVLSMPKVDTADIYISVDRGFGIMTTDELRKFLSSIKNKK